MESDVVFTCFQGGRYLRVSAWDLSTGTVRRTYSCDADCGGSCVCLLAKQYLLCALQTAPFIYVWNVKKEQLHMKISCSGVVNALTCSPEGIYCAAAIAERIHIWEVSTGHLLAVVSQHYQVISVLRFTDDGVHLISGGEDARVIVWRMSNVLSEAYISSGRTTPHSPGSLMPTVTSKATRHIWSDHSLPVTDIHCGRGAARSRVATVSLDQTCKVYEVSSGRLLCSFLFEFGLTSVTMDLPEYRLFVGGNNGKIAQVNLFLQHLGRTEQVTDDKDNADQQRMYFSGHMKPVTGLAVSSWGHLLVSASEDGTARVWDISSHQTLRTVTLKGPVSSMFLASSLGLPLVSDPTHLPLKQFMKQIYRASGETVPVVIPGTDPLCDLASLKYCECGYVPLGCTSSGKNSDLEVLKLRQKVSELKEIHQRLYTLAVDKPLETLQEQ